MLLFVLPFNLHVSNGWMCLVNVYDDCSTVLYLQGERIIKYNIPIEAHAAQIYTRNMYEKFCKLIFDSGSFVAFKIIPHMKYKTRHIRAVKREKWEKVEFNIDVTCNGEQYICECGLSEHMGMLCPHIIRVSSS